MTIICAWCRRVLRGEGEPVSHGICADCAVLGEPWPDDVVPREEDLLAALKDLREASTSAYKQGRVDAESFVRAGNIIAKVEGR